MERPRRPGWRGCLGRPVAPPVASPVTPKPLAPPWSLCRRVAVSPCRPVRRVAQARGRAPARASGRADRSGPEVAGAVAHRPGANGGAHPPSARVGPVSFPATTSASAWVRRWASAGPSPRPAPRAQPSASAPRAEQSVVSSPSGAPFLEVEGTRCGRWLMRRCAPTACVQDAGRVSASSHTDCRGLYPGACFGARGRTRLPRPGNERGAPGRAPDQAPRRRRRPEPEPAGRAPCPRRR